MQKLKFLSLLKKLSRLELEGFQKHLKRYHPREKNAQLVFEYLLRYYPDFEPTEKIQIEHVYQKIFKTGFDSEGHAQKKMLNTVSELYNRLKTFLIISKTQQNQPLQEMIWLSILQERELKDEFSRKATVFYQQTRSAPFTSPADALPNWMASYFHREHLTWEKLSIHAQSIEQCTETMADCWEIIRLKMACEMSLLKKVPDHSPTQSGKAAIDFQQPGQTLLMDTYEALWQLTDSGKEVYFDRLESLLIQHGQNIDPKELKWIIRCAYNFAADQSRHNQDAIQYERTHRLNKIGLTYGVFFQDGYLPSSAFGNIVTVACLTKDFDWAAGFIRDYSHIIFEHNRREAILLAQAILAFETGKFKDVLYLLEPAGFEAHLDILRSKSLLLRSYYELQADQDTILDTCAYFENLLRRSPKSEAVKAMLAFVLILKRLVAQKSSKKSILDCIEKAPLLYSKKWLLEKTVHYKARYAARKIALERHT